MARKNKAPLADDALPPVKPERHLSGADIESVVLAAKRRALAAGRSDLGKADVEEALNEFIPSAQGLEKEKQELAAVLECTSLSFLPEEWRTRIAQPDGPTQIIANQGRYNMDTQKVAIDGPVVLTAANNYRVTTRDVLVDMTAKTAVSRAPVDGTMKLGTFSGNRLVADLNDHTVVLDGGARLHIARTHVTPPK